MPKLHRRRRRGAGPGGGAWRGGAWRGGAGGGGTGASPREPMGLVRSSYGLLLVPGSGIIWAR
ncbi:hypothetical protein ABZU76_44765 [Amycolatopsis sp. NPDC005232]|uniref:hypothetical protein n=1 Tax=Amycolatopsis sp. NPDC005232 TaxID=3157027 RepID=UPI0033A66075